MDIEIISSESVKLAQNEAHRLLEKTDKFNTNSHTREQISARIPEVGGLVHVKPDRHPTEFIHWVHLITQSRQIPPNAWHIFELSPAIISVIRDATRIWAIKGGISKSSSEEVIDRFPRATKAGVPIETVLSPENRWFLRLEYCSAKDSDYVEPESGIRGCVTSKESIANILCSSSRALGASELFKRNPDSPEQIYLLPWDDSMDPRREYRVFCPPLQNRVTAVSQYSWFQPFELDTSEDIAIRADRVVRGITEIHQQILKHAEETMESSIREKLNTEGFVFDVLETQDGKVQLIELNPFGAMSGCGSCLYHWIEDAEVIYGQRDRIEFRIMRHTEAKEEAKEEAK
ncbi:hypothetical protein C8J56DRAFT_910926 [Mycena floridula]|nr:hypothetical protein C8J56DRAFT_910926 [Mycena floridula]